MTINRIVILLTPIFAALAGWVTELVARYFPGHPHLDRAELTAIFIAGVAFAAAHVLLWLHGWQKHEARLPVNTGSATAPQNSPATPLA